MAKSCRESDVSDVDVPSETYVELDLSWISSGSEYDEIDLDCSFTSSEDENVLDGAEHDAGGKYSICFHQFSFKPVSTSGEMKAQVKDAAEFYRAQRREVDHYRYGHGQGHSQSIQYSEKSLQAFFEAGKSITALEKLGSEIDLGTQRAMRHWVKATKELTIIVANEVNLRIARHLCNDDIEKLQETSSGFLLPGTPEAKFTKKAGRLMLRYAVLRRRVKNGHVSKQLLINTDLKPFDIYTSIKVKQLNRQVTCEYCKKTYSQCYLPVHLRTHRNERPFQCKQCDKKFADKSNLNQHLKCCI
ncbi:hypothetical protein ONE63_000999 [Megalurothrips usitatus]|uniref:C2H2-type domain-containing protein n=1 Tax=Megalurothrips usitatus TaxID=439358 RepID=A0AAV7XCX3_9NEOP|nr:hypothetical protein ONE63_000999 [Megalurothrips usitatus]